MNGLTALANRRRLAGGAGSVGLVLVVLSVSLAVVLALGSAALAQGPAPGGMGQIYTCTDATGKRLTSDRPIADCNAREQRVLNADGSVKRVIAPTLTSDERAELEAREREAAAERATKQDAIRRDRNLLTRFPDEAAHRKARAAALDDLRKALRLSEVRIGLLAAERKPLIDEAEFYTGKPLPAKLKSQLDANDATIEAQRMLAQNLQVEGVRINQLYDTELERLKKLWGGAQPGSLGRLGGGAASALSPASSPQKVRR